MLHQLLQTQHVVREDGEVVVCENYGLGFVGGSEEVERNEKNGFSLVFTMCLPSFQLLQFKVLL